MEETKSASPNGKPSVLQDAPRRKGFRYWLGVLPGSKFDYFLLFFTAIDVFALFFKASYDIYLPIELKNSIIGFDIGIIVVWAFYLIARMRKEKNKTAYLLMHWHEILGMVPVFMLRPLLLLRAAKLAIAFYKFGRSEQDVSRLITRDIAFRFRDVIVDTIADAVFLQSLDRVEEVMLRLDYGRLARRVFGEHEAILRDAVNESLLSKSMVGELTRIPFMTAFANRLGEDVSRVIIEVLETEVTGDIMKEITRGILLEMRDRVRVLDIERLTGEKFEVAEKARPVAEDSGK